MLVVKAVHVPTVAVIHDNRYFLWSSSLCGTGDRSFMIVLCCLELLSGFRTAIVIAACGGFALYFLMFVVFFCVLLSFACWFRWAMVIELLLTLS